jgi:hypothetical protein
MTRGVLIFVAPLIVGPLLALHVGPALVAAAPQTRATNSTPTGRAAIISGLVVGNENPAVPIVRAVVVLRGAEIQPAMQTVTDEAGHFVFGGLPAGSFTVTASRPGYLTMSYGQETAGQGSGLPVAIRAGQQATDLRILLPRGSAISGQVTDQAGSPVENSRIIVAQYRTINGEPRLANAGGISSNTDNHGAYRVYGLPPGEYFICALRPGNFLGIPQSCSSGGGESIREISTAEVQWAQQQIRAAASRGVGATPGTVAAPPPPPGSSVSYGATFYPQSTDPAGAVGVTVGPGEERAGVDIVMIRQAVGSVDAIILGVDGQPAVGARVSFSDGFGTSSRTTPDGKFSASGLWPGRYTLSATAGDARATLDVVISGGDAQTPVLRMQPAGVTTASLSGRVTFDATTLTPPAVLSAARVSLVRERPSGLLTSTMNADGIFTIAGIEPGRYRVQASFGGQPTSGPTWQLKTVTVGGQEASDSFFEVVAGQNVSDALVTFTDRPSELSGTLQDALGRPAGGFYVLIFPGEKIFWRQGARRLPPPVRSATDGRYRFSNLPAGRYHLVALTDVNQNDVYDEAFLMSLLPASIDVTIADGEKKVQDLKIGR